MRPSSGSASPPYGPHDRDSPEWATAIAGLIAIGLLTHADSNTAVLPDDVQYGLHLIDSDETNTC